MVVGDFNAQVGGAFYNEWTAPREEMDMVFSDVEMLEGSSYTHVNNASLSRTWIDHCLSSATVHSSIQEIFINYDFFCV